MDGNFLSFCPKVLKKYAVNFFVDKNKASIEKRKDGKKLC